MSTTPSLSDFKALVFDCYGTLIDWESGIYTALQPLLSSHKSTPGWTRQEALAAFVSVELDIQARRPRTLYADVLAGAYDALARRLRGAPDAPSAAAAVSDPAPAVVVSSAPGTADQPAQAGTSGGQEPEADYSEEAKTFAASVKDWPAFEDTVGALQRLKNLGLTLVILSNVDRASFEGTRRLFAQRGFAFDAVYTAEEIGSYKPNPNNHRFVLDALQTPKEQVLAVAQSLVHDHVPARSLGLRSVWIDRAGASIGVDGDGVPVDRAGKESFATWRFETMAQFADAYEAALGR